MFLRITAQICWVIFVLMFPCAFQHLLRLIFISGQRADAAIWLGISLAVMAITRLVIVRVRKIESDDTITEKR